MLLSLPFVPINNLLLVFKFDLTFWVNLILLSVFAMALGTESNLVYLFITVFPQYFRTAVPTVSMVRLLIQLY